MKFPKLSILFIILCVLTLPLFGQDSKALVHQIKITTDKAPDTSSLKSIAESVTKGLTTNDEKAIAIYNYLIYNNYHFQYPSEAGGVAALKVLNVYGWSLCGGLHSIQSSLWREMGWKWRFIGWDGHTTVEAFYDDKWHYFDVFSKFYCWRDDPTAPGGRTVASQDDIGKNPDIVLQGLVFDSGREVYYAKGNEFKNINGKANWTAPVFLPCKDDPKYIVTECKKPRSNNGSPTDWAGIKFNEDGYSTDVNLPTGMSLDMLWSKIDGSHWWFPDRKRLAKHSCSERDFRNSPSCGLLIEPYRQVYKQEGRSFSSGRFAFKPTISKNIIDSFDSADNIKIDGTTITQADTSKPAWFVVNMSSPYVMSTAKGVITDVETVEISTDKGKTYKPFLLSNFNDAIGGKYGALIKVPVAKPISAIDIEIIVEQNYRALPYLSPGKNEVTVSLAKPEELKDNNLVVTYVFQVGSKSKSFEDYVDAGKEVAKSHNTEWGPEVSYVQKIIKASDFKDGKFKFNIDLPTPKGKYPAYPRMINLKREIIGPNDKPAPLPEGAVAYKTPEGQEFMTLPYPFHLDLIKPEVEKPRKIKSEKLKAEFGFAVSEAGQVAENHYIKVKPNENWDILMKADLSTLKDANSFNALKIALPVIRGHAKAKVKIAAFLLSEPYELNKPYDFKKIGTTDIGVTILPIQPEEKDYSPAQYFFIDITKAAKGFVKEGKKEIYLAITTIPDRTVDDGHTVRADFDHKAEFYLSVENFVD